jgi:integrating conjugative element protein (TIGR03752 family)
MAIGRSKLVPVLGGAIVLIIGAVVVTRCTGGDGHVKADKPMTAVPGASTDKKGKDKEADQDTPVETLRTVVAGQKELRTQVTQVLDQNKTLQRELAQAQSLAQARANMNIPGSANAANAGGAATATATATGAGTAANSPVSASSASPGAAAASSGEERPGVIDAFGAALTQASNTISNARPGAAKGAGAKADAGKGTSASDGARDTGDAASYQVITPMGYAAYTAQSHNGPPTTSYVRTSSPADSGAVKSGADTAARAASAAQSAVDPKKPIPYFTLPENATLVGATSMTSLIGRVPIDGHVTDPMQFKLVVGHDNLAANGFELPDDIAGMIVSGVAIGDMALSCTEGKLQSFTFVFNDGSIRTVSKRSSVQLQNSTGTTGGSANTNNDLGYISDMHGNPCIQGKFVTNAGAFLADIIGVEGLSAAGQAYSSAQTMTTQSATNGVTQAVTGNIGKYAMGQAVVGAGSEVTKWLLAREKNSFDAVVTPSGQQLVVHLNQEIDIDKAPDARKLVHRSQEPQPLAGARYGLE